MGLKLSEVLAIIERGGQVEYKVYSEDDWRLLDVWLGAQYINLRVRAEYREVKTKPHFIGATYELTQANMNNLIRQLEEYMNKDNK